MFHGRCRGWLVGGAGDVNWWCWLVSWRVLLVVCLLLDVLAVPPAGCAAATTLPGALPPEPITKSNNMKSATNY